MHVYIYDSFVNQKKYNNILAKIENRITDLGLNGKICRIGPMQNLNTVIEKELERNIKTIVVVGNDETIHKSIKSLVDTKIPLGIIPIGKNNEFAENFGIKAFESACEILASRRIENFSLGEANNKYFLNKASITTKNTLLEIDASYSIEILGKGIINIINLPSKSDFIDSVQNNQKNNGQLKLFINVKEQDGFFSKHISQTVLPIKRIKINNKTHKLLLDNSVELATPVELRTSTKKINIIVGKDRIY